MKILHIYNHLILKNFFNKFLCFYSPKSSPQQQKRGRVEGERRRWGNGWPAVNAGSGRGGDKDGKQSPRSGGDLRKKGSHGGPICSKQRRENRWEKQGRRNNQNTAEEF